MYSSIITDMNTDNQELLLRLSLIEIALKKIPSKEALAKEVCAELTAQFIDQGYLREGESLQEDLIQGDKSAAEFLNVSKSTVFNWRKSRQIPFKRINGRIFFSKAELVSAMKKFGR